MACRIAKRQDFFVVVVVVVVGGGRAIYSLEACYTFTEAARELRYHGKCVKNFHHHFWPSGRALVVILHYPLFGYCFIMLLCLF